MKLKRRSPGRPPRLPDSAATTPVVDLRQLLEALEREGTTVMDLASAGRTPEPWTVYPGESGIFDRTTGYQVYYHRHEPRAAEAGHFHTVRLFPDRVAHLVAISMAPDGWPQALFTVNLWAVGDADEGAQDLRRYAQTFHIDERRFEVDRGVPRDRLTPVVRFVNLVFQAFFRRDRRAAARQGPGTRGPPPAAPGGRSLHRRLARGPEPDRDQPPGADRARASLRSPTAPGR